MAQLDEEECHFFTFNHANLSRSKDFSARFARYFQAFHQAATDESTGFITANAMACLAALCNGYDVETTLARIAEYEEDPETIVSLVHNVCRDTQPAPAPKADAENQQFRLRKAAREAKANPGKALNTLMSKDRVMTRSQQEGIWAEDPRDGIRPRDPTQILPPTPSTLILLCLPREHRQALAHITPICPGADGLTWSDLKRIMEDPTASNTLVDLIHRYANARLPQLTTRILAGGKDLILSKSNGGLRPIVLPSVIHRLMGRLAMRFLGPATQAAKAPYQLGIGKKGGERHCDSHCSCLTEEWRRTDCSGNRH